MDSLADRLIELKQRCLHCWAKEFSDIHPQKLNSYLAGEELHRYGNPACVCNGNYSDIFPKKHINRNIRGSGMTNEEFLKHAEKYYDQKSFEHAKKLVAVAEAANNITVSASTKDALWEVNVEMMQLEKALENLERE